jgi:hypothetical protein
MGKVANNERLRMRAMFFNTLAVACIITGLFVPYFVMLTAWGRMIVFFEALVTADWARLQGGMVELLATAVALVLGFLFRRKADRIVQSMQD